MLRIGIDPEKLYPATVRMPGWPMLFQSNGPNFSFVKIWASGLPPPPPPAKKFPVCLCLLGYTKGNSYELMLNNLDVYRSQIVPLSWGLGTVTGDYSYTLGEKKFSNEKEPRLAI